MSTAKILVVMEGKQPEGNIFSRLQRSFPEELADFKENLVKTVFTSNIYELYETLCEKGVDWDVVEALKKHNKNNSEIQNLKRAEFSQTFLFFDLDAHCRKDLATDLIKVNDLIHYFTDETEMGKMYISYPMVESTNVCDYDFGLMGDAQRLFAIDDCKNDGYKKFANNLNALYSEKMCRANNRDNWLWICSANYKKARWIIKGNAVGWEDDLIQMDQKSIFKGELRFIQENKSVAALSAFPFFLKEYIGSEKTKRLFM